MPAPEITQFFSKYLVIFSDRPKQRNKDVAMLLEMHGDAQPRHDAVHGLSKHVGQQADRSLFVEFDEHNDIRHRNMGAPGLMVDRRRQHRPAPGDRSRRDIFRQASSADRRAGKECVSTCIAWWRGYPSITTQTYHRRQKN